MKDDEAAALEEIVLLLHVIAVRLNKLEKRIKELENGS